MTKTLDYVNIFVKNGLEILQDFTENKFQENKEYWDEEYGQWYRENNYISEMTDELIATLQFNIERKHIYHNQKDYHLEIRKLWRY